MDDRLQVLKAALDSSFASECKRARLDCSKRGSDIVQSAIAKAMPRQVEGRAERVQNGDVGLAVVAAAYDLEANGRWLWPTLGRFPDIAEHDWNTIGRLADQLVQRFDSNEISPKLGAYVAGICSSYTGWSGRRNADRASVGAFFNALASQCDGNPTVNAQWRSGSKIGGPVCILANNEDTVVSPRWASDWKAVFPRASLGDYKYRGHIALTQAFALTGNASRCGDGFRSEFERKT
jgi:hypothetical protein